jgi:NADH-quinone oxidoreductase subunit L
MEAPVPASSLIHSATLVSAGIFILIRFTSLFEKSYLIILLIAIIGSITAFYGGLVSMFQSDTKRILAYSTISHCGFLMVIYTTFIYEYLILYLYIHGFFKAATFMCVGNVNRFSLNNQDFKNMGLYYKFIPFDCYLCFIGLANLSGLPFTLGFYIKHLLFLGFNSNMYVYYFIFLSCLFGAFTGLFYSFRLFYYVFFDFKKSKKRLYDHVIGQNLFSYFYSNTTLVSNCAILTLFSVSYIIGLYFLFSFTSGNHIFSTFLSNNEFLIYLLNFTNYFSFLLNLSLIN